MKYRDWTNSTEEVEFVSSYIFCVGLYGSCCYFIWNDGIREQEANNIDMPKEARCTLRCCVVVVVVAFGVGVVVVVVVLLSSLMFEWDPFFLQP